MSDFDKEDVVIRAVAETAIYFNEDGDIVIAQIGIHNDFVIIPPYLAHAVIAKLHQLLSSEDEAK